MEQKVKVGDLVEILYSSKELFESFDYKGRYTKGDRGVVAELLGKSLRLEGDLNTSHWLKPSHVRLLSTRKQRTHAGMIIAWAKDSRLLVEAEIEGKWLDVSEPKWLSNVTYRFKSLEEGLAVEKEREILSSQIKELQIRLDKLPESMF